MRQVIFGLCALLVVLNVRANDSKFALICEWNMGQTGGSQTFHIDLVKNTVDGRSAKITDSLIIFVKDDTEYTIDRVSGVLQTKDLKPIGLRLAGPIVRCKKVAELKQF